MPVCTYIPYYNTLDANSYTRFYLVRYAAAECECECEIIYRVTALASPLYAMRPHRYAVLLNHLPVIA